ncbi:MAG: SemiSWEET transporter [Acidobacteriaceae bacterium]
MRLTLWVVNLVGTAAAVCTTIAFVPQLVRVYRLKTARDISFAMFLVFSVGELLWLIYGIFIHSLPVILANAVTLGLALAILSLKARYDRL